MVDSSSIGSNMHDDGESHHHEAPALSLHMLSNKSEPLRGASRRNRNSCTTGRHHFHGDNQRILRHRPLWLWAAATVAGIFHRLLVRYHTFTAICVLIFPISLLSMHWNLMMEVEKASERVGGSEERQSHNTTYLAPPFVPYERQRKKSKPNKSKPNPSGKDDQPGHILRSVVPSSVFEPHLSQPLQVVYIGATVSASSGNNDKNDYEDPYLDALERSSYVNVLASFGYDSKSGRTLLHASSDNTIHPPRVSVVIVDWASLYRDCHVLHRILARVLQQLQWLVTTDSSKSHYWLFLDDTASPRIETCSIAINATRNDHGGGENRIHMAKRSMVVGRRWNYTQQWVETGRAVSSGATEQSAATHLWSGFLTETFVRYLRDAYGSLEQGGLGRHIDVAHYWKATSRGQHDENHHFFYNRLRRAVSSQLQLTQKSLSEAYSKSKKRSRPKSVWVDRVGMVLRNKEEHSKDDKVNDDENVDISLAHVAMLVSSKIVVVAQADEWEDHDNRLTEAMASGALVLCDTMMVPQLGLQHETNIVFYNSLAQLDSFIRFYLNPANRERREAIGRRGAEWSLSLHRSSHVLESLLFGKALTVSDRKETAQRTPVRRQGPAGV